ncbi:conserved hypothetical protein [uncultured Paludibacter sp.]|nr:conserved hypothetical protein [uncultured Paludibacter sp.]
MPENYTQSHWIVITNPKAGKRKLPAQKKFILTELNKATIPHTFIETEYAGHAIKIARENAEKGFLNFLVLGGDGSISEVINGIFSAEIEDTSKVKIALIPRGTGNDWGRFWKLKKNDKSSFKIFLEGYSRFIDIGKITLKHQEQTSFRYFINSVGFGLDAKVADLTHTLKHYVGSFSLLYTISLLIAVFRYKSINSRIEINGVPHYINLFTMNIANGPYSGGGIKQNPSALPYDSIFDMMFVEKPTLKDILTVLPHIFNGKITKHKVIQSFKTEKIVLNCDKGTFFETDGLVSKNAQNFEISILPKSIQMVVPEEFIKH